MARPKKEISETTEAPQAPRKKAPRKLTMIKPDRDLIRLQMLLGLFKSEPGTYYAGTATASLGVNQATAHLTLVDYEERKLVKSKLISTEGRGAKRRVYTLTAKGQRIAEAAL